MLDKQFASIFRLYRIARSSTILLLNLLLVYLVNTTCAIINIMANLIFTIVSLSVTCILSCCSCPLILLFLSAYLPPRTCRNCGNSFIPTATGRTQWLLLPMKDGTDQSSHEVPAGPPRNILKHINAMFPAKCLLVPNN